MIRRASCHVCGDPVNVTRDGPATCSAACAAESARVIDIHATPDEWRRLRNWIANAHPGVPQQTRVAGWVIRFVVEVEAAPAGEVHEVVP